MAHPVAAFRWLVMSIAAVSMFTACSLATASPTVTYPDANASDPAKLGWMVGSPPSADRTVRFEDGSYFQFPAMR